MSTDREHKKELLGEFRIALEEFALQIEGFRSERDRRYYTSVIINRILFVYFLQLRGFVNRGDTQYLKKKFEESGKRQTNGFHKFLAILFFEGFGRPEDRRDNETNKLIGVVPYMATGLFLEHRLERENPGTTIPDRAFADLFRFLDACHWTLEEGAEATDLINPAVLGYVFEKYINDKSFGAYYTPPAMTEYLCEKTIHDSILERLAARGGPRYESIAELSNQLDEAACTHLLEEILPNLTILDPACGSGAFLIAAMNTLIGIYSAVVGTVLHHAWPATEKYKREIASHGSPDYYIRKTIIATNLFGVDIMEEAVEIAGLRLYLSLISAIGETRKLEPLAKIELNIKTGNSLIGFLKTSETPDASRGVSRERLNELLLKEFTDKHGIKYEEARPKGRAKKRELVLADMEELRPFHWSCHFPDVVLERGGFDVILANPPWEIFKPNAREFFLRYSDLIQKKKMTIRSFEKARSELLADDDIAAAWREYRSGFPHVSAYFRQADDYKNQISYMHGRKVGSDINLYKLFLERCHALLRDGGHCGIILPAGIYNDLGAKQLRIMLFGNARIRSLFAFSNEKFIFEDVHHAHKFCLLEFSKGGKTAHFQAAFRINPREALRKDELECFLSDDSEHISIDIELIKALSPDSLSIMEFKGPLDKRIAEKLSSFPLLGECREKGRRLSLKREFDMTNHSHLFQERAGENRLVLYEGKMTHQFTHQFGTARYWIDEKAGRKSILGNREDDSGAELDYEHYRLCFRAVAANTDERSTICAILPRNVFAGNSLLVSRIFDDRGDVLTSPADLLYLCAVMNSFVVDYLNRQKITKNLNMFYVYQTPVPRLAQGDPRFDEITECAARLICTTPAFEDLAREMGLGSHKNGVADETHRAELRAEIDGLVAHLYGLTEQEFRYVLSTFPVVSDAVRAAALNEYREPAVLSRSR